LERDKEPMKGIALSVRQPWASLIVLGLKTIEIRSWSTDYRGCLFIHASKTLDDRAMKRFQIENPSVGALIGTVELIRVERFTESTWEELADEHLEIGPLSPSLYAWHMANPKPFAKPVPYRGDRGLFPITIDDAFGPFEKRSEGGSGLD